MTDSIEIRACDGNGHMPEDTPLDDLTGEARVTALACEVEELADIIEKLIPVVSHLAERVVDLDLRADEARIPMLDKDDYPVEPPGHVMKTYWLGWSDAQVAAYAVTPS